MKNIIKNKFSFCVSIFFWILIVLCLLPFWIALIISITDEKTIIQSGYSLLPKQISFHAYEYLFQVPRTILTAYGITISVTVIGACVSLLISAMFAYTLSRRDFPLRTPLTFIVFFTILFNGGLVPWYLVYSNILHLNDTIFALIVPNLLMNGFFVLIIRTFFLTTVPVSILESALMDGAGELRIFFQIVLPLARPVLATIGLFTTFNYWNDWYNSMIFIDNPMLYNIQCLMNKILMNITFLDKNSAFMNPARNFATIPTESARMAMAIIGIGPIIFVYPFLQKYFVKGLTVGAVKG